MHTGIIYLLARHLGQGDGKGCQLLLVILLMLSTTSFIFLNFLSPSSHSPKAFPHFNNLTVALQRWCMNIIYLCFWEEQFGAEFKFRMQQSKNCQPCWWRGVLQRTWHSQICRSNLFCSQKVPDLPLETSHLLCDWQRRLTSPWIHQTERVSSRGLGWLRQLQYFQLFSFLICSSCRQIACQLAKLV